MVHTASSGFDPSDYLLFTQKVRHRLGIHLSGYKEDQMKRRLGVIAQRTRSSNFLAYLEAIENDNGLLTEFLDQMTINVTELFRNPELFEVLKHEVLPRLLKNRPSQPFVGWSAGCSYGAEAYSLAMILNELAPTVPFRVRGTDVDLCVIGRATSPYFSPADMANVSPERRATFFRQADGIHYLPNTELRSKLSFSRHDLLADPYPSEEYDLIMCRNVVIYFTSEAKERIFQGFYKALRPGGILFVGGTERLANHNSIGFKLIKPFFYQKPG